MPVLVLGEPTAHLDGPTATRLIEDVFAAAGDRCVLLITHRPEGLDLADDRGELLRLHPIRSSRWSPTRSEFAIAVNAGFTAPMLGKTLVSTT